MRHLIQIGVVLTSLLLVVDAVYPQWVQTNGPEGGNVYCFAFMDSNIFAGTDVGVFRSTNHGRNWLKANHCIEDLSVGCLYIFNSIIFAGTQGYGIYTSTDMGNTWTTSNNGMTSSYITGFTVIDTNLFVSTNCNEARSGGVYRTTNYGLNWEEINADTSSNYCTLCIAAYGNILLTGGGEGINRSTDQGKTWTWVNNGVEGLSIRTIIEVNSKLYAVGWGRGIFFSNDSGQNWNFLSSSGFGTNTIILIDTLLFGASNITEYNFQPVSRSTDYGVTWEYMNDGLPRKAVYALGSDGTNIFAGTDGWGIYCSTNFGETWDSSNGGLISSFVVSMIYSKPHLIVGTNDERLFHSTDDGENWYLYDMGFSYPTIYSFAVVNPYIFASGATRIYRTDSIAYNWTEAINGLDNNWICNLSAFQGNLLAFTDNDVYRSTNFGMNWDSLDADLPEVYIVRTAINSTDIFATTCTKGTYRSTNGGKNWTLIGGELNDFCANAIAISDTNLFLSTSYGTFISSNYGETWTDVSIQQDVSRFLVHGKNIFAGTNGAGIFLTSDNGINWVDISEGLYNKSIYSLSISDKFLFAGTRSGSVWRRPLSEIIDNVNISSKDIPPIFALQQNYPNPFNPSTQISFSVPKATDVTLKIYNVLGREVALLVNERKQAGEYKVTWNAEGVPSGVYFYRIVAGDFVETKKMVVVK